MFTSNPFADLAVFLPPFVTQAYIVLMIFAIAIEALVDRYAGLRCFHQSEVGRLKKSHAKDIIVCWPDGRKTKDIETHIEDLKAMFVYAPDTRIKEHPVKSASGDGPAWSGSWKRPSPGPCPRSVARPSRPLANRSS